MERSGRARDVLVECLCNFSDVDNYPLLLMVTRQKDRVILVDFIRGNSSFDETRSCLERTLNPVFDESIRLSNESISAGWIGGRTAGNIRRRPSFVTSKILFCTGKQNLVRFLSLSFESIGSSVTSTSLHFILRTESQHARSYRDYERRTTMGDGKTSSQRFLLAYSIVINFE